MIFVTGGVDVQVGTGSARKSTGGTHSTEKSERDRKLYHQSRKAVIITENRKLWKIIPVFVRLGIPLMGPLYKCVYFVSFQFCTFLTKNFDVFKQDGFNFKKQVEH
jgi:hypothetical protein